MSDYVSLKIGPTVKKYHTNLVFHTFEEWQCYCALLDVFNREDNLRALVLINDECETYLIQMENGSAISTLATPSMYGFLKERGFRWLSMFDCLVDTDNLYGEDPSLLWYDKFRSDNWKKSNDWLLRDRLRESIDDLAQTGVLIPAGEESLFGVKSSAVECFVYDVPSMSADLPTDYKWGLLDDYIYSLDGTNLRKGSFYLNQNIKDNRLETKLYVSKNASKTIRYNDGTPISEYYKMYRRRR